jgi:hypothetical protein
MSSIFDRLLGGQKGPAEESLNDQRADLDGNFIVALDPSMPGCEQLDGATGEFGSETNPIPVNGSIGEAVYLNRLRTGAGVEFFFHRERTIVSPKWDVHLDRCELVTTDASEWRVLFFSMHHPYRSMLLPPGLQRIPWPKDRHGHQLLKIPVMGVLKKVPEFPLGLPYAMEEFRDLDRINPDLTDRTARRVAEILELHRDRWTRPDWVDVP